MDALDTDHPLSMVRDHLDDLPQHPLPAGYSIRWYQPGDETVWGAIQAAADQYNEITPALFLQEFGDNAEVLKQRLGFLLDRQNQALGTATAWFNPAYHGAGYGRIHWVAIVPEMQGRGLAKPLMTAVCNRMRVLGHERAYLTTSPMRLPAIRLYHRFGFRPEIKHARDAAAWLEIEHVLGGFL